MRLAINVTILIAILVIFKTITTFLDIPIQVYLIYFIWFISMFLFYFILPTNFNYFTSV